MLLYTGHMIYHMNKVTEIGLDTIHDVDLMLLKNFSYWGVLHNARHPHNTF